MRSESAWKVGLDYRTGESRAIELWVLSGYLSDARRNCNAFELASGPADLDRLWFVFKSEDNVG
jgi:hypothetical protein